MGESAGGYFATALGVLGETREYDQGDNLEYSSQVQTVISWYGALDLLKLLPPEDDVNFPRDLKNYLELSKFITEQTPPFLLLHGMKDSQVDYQSSVNFYEKLQEKGIVSDLVLIGDAEHADAPFVQDEIKNIIMEFIKKNIK